MGAVDLVCQVESPGSVARGLQRVGRAGHLVGRRSKGRLIAKTPGDLLESAALCAGDGPRRGRGAPRADDCLDVLAQQVVACVAVDRWDVPALFDLVRGAYPYRDLSAVGLRGRAGAGLRPVPDRARCRDLRPRVSWDRVHNRLHAAARHAAARGDRRRDDPRHRPVPGLPRRRRAAAGRAGRGVRARAPGRRDVRARHRHLADRGDRAAPRPRGPAEGRAA